MITLAVVLVSVAVYLLLGWRVIAPRYVTRAVARSMAGAESHRRTAANAAKWRRAAAAEGAAVGLVWPLYVLARTVHLLGTLLVSGIAARAPLTDLEARHAIAERDRRIAELEQTR